MEEPAAAMPRGSPLLWCGRDLPAEVALIGTGLASMDDDPYESVLVAEWIRVGGDQRESVAEHVVTQEAIFSAPANS